MNRVFYESGDVSRVSGYSPQYVRRLTDSGRLRVAARTLRGGRLYDPADVEEFRRQAAERRSVRRGAGGLGKKA